MWIEYKYFSTNKSRFNLLLPEKTPKLTRRQQGWLNSRHDEGRVVWVIVGMPAGGIILMNKEWMEPIEVRAVMSRHELAQEIMQICGT